VLITLCAALGLGTWYSRAWTSLSAVNRHSELWYPMPTHAKPRSNTAPNDEFKGRRLFVIGDSHVAAYGLLLQRLQNDTGLEVRQYWDAGCTAAGLMRPANAGCADFLQRAVDAVRPQAQRGDIAFLPGLRTPRLGDQWAAFDEAQVLATLRSPQAVAESAAALREATAFIAQLEQLGLVVLFELPKPTFAAPPFRCADWFNRANPICAPGVRIERARLAALAQPTNDSIAELRTRHPEMQFWDPLPLLCPDSVCSAFDDAGQPLFADGDHLSGQGNRVLHEPFLAVLRAVYAQKRPGAAP
jgi:lysophospholipase L1-like esterase